MKIIIFLCSLLFVSYCVGQKTDMALFKEMSVRNIGPAGMSGRITAIDVNLKNKDHILVGSASGGVWESKNGGITWEPIFDDAGLLSIGDVAFNQSNPSEIWVGTGEGNPRNSMNSGAGIYRSIDGGKTWKLKGLKNTKTIHRILIDPSNPKTIYVGSLGSIWGPNKERGVYKSTDSGATWENILFVNNETGAADMVMDPENPNKIIVAMWEYGRKPWTFNSGGPGSGLYISYDGGASWKQKTSQDGLPKGNIGRVGIAIAHSNPDIVYALVEAEVNGLYKSTDGGEKWSIVSKKNIGDRPFYYAEIYVDPSNENRLYNLYTYVARSEDGGKTFENIMNYGNDIHPDHHAFWIDPDNPKFLIDGNDGGLNISRDGAEHWKFINNLPVGQFYHINIDDDFPYNVYGGMQDNGTWGGPSSVLRRGGINNYDWQEISFGDGFDILPDPTNSRYGFTQSQGGFVQRYDKLTGRRQIVKPVHPDGTYLRFNWNAAIGQDPFDACSVYFGSQYVHYSKDCGLSWEIISPDLTRNEPDKQKQHLSGGLTKDVTQAENYNTILAICPSPLEKGVIWVGTDDGRLQLTKDGGKNWMDVGKNIKSMPKGAWIPQIHVSEYNPAEAFIVVNDYRRNNWEAYAYHTSDYGKTWKRIGDNRNIGGFVCSIIQDPEVEDLLFLGTDVGLYVSFNKGQNWEKWTNDLPPVQIRDMKIHKEEGDLIIGTFGRSIWILDDISPLRAYAQNKNNELKDFQLLESPPIYLTSTRSYQGIRFHAQGEFQAPSKPRSAEINYYISASDKKQQDQNTINFWVLDQNRDTIRHQSTTAKEGFAKFAWDKRTKGVNFPNRYKRHDDEEPSGISAPPGKYLVVAIFQEIKDSIEIKLQEDPRIEYDEKGIIDKQRYYQSYNKQVKLADEALTKLLDAQESIKKVNSISYGLQDSMAMELTEHGKKLIAEIDSLMDLFQNPSGIKGIQRNPQHLNNQLGSTLRNIGSSWDTIGENTEYMVNNSTESVARIEEAINMFLDGPYKSYQELVNSLDFDLFKKVK